MVPAVGVTIAIDGVFMTTSQPGGYRSYTTNLVGALAALGSSYSFHVLVDRPVELGLPASWRTELLSRRGSVGFIWREQVAIPRHVANDGTDLLHVPGATGPLRLDVPMVATIYDTIEFAEPLPSPIAAKRWAMRLYSRFVQARVARRAKHVITISAYAKVQIMQRLGVDGADVSVIHLAPAAHFTPTETSAQQSIRSGMGIAPGYVLGIASATPRKNSAAVLAAYAMLLPSVRLQHPLVLVCTHPGVAEAVRASAEKLSLGESVRILHDVSDEQLAVLYRHAGVFVFPSYEEGFGLPPLEAMASGAPVIASDTSSLPEVLGDAAILVSPSDVNGLATALESVLTDRGLADMLRDKGSQHSQRFSWEKTARETLAVYESVLNGCRR